MLTEFRLFSRKGWRRISQNAHWVLARFVDDSLSEGQFLRALDKRFATPEEYLHHLRLREIPRFFVDSGRRQTTVAAIRAHCPEAESLIISVADRTCHHVFDLLGSGPVHLGDDIDWHCDFKTGHRWNPRQYYAHVRPAPYPGGYDIKVPWELSRCQHFATLGQAYWFTGDEKYAREFRDEILDWIDSNPTGYGVNWACTMDVAIRAVNWIWGYRFFKESRSFDDNARWELFKSMLVHGRFIIRNLETWDTPNNHLVADGAGLVYLGLMFPEFSESRRWLATGLEIVYGEIERQVYDDGVSFEGSIAYHRLAAEMFISCVILCQLNHLQVPGEVLTRLEKMLEFVLHYTKPDGTVPLIGDADNGRLQRLQAWVEAEREWIDHRHLLAIGAVMFHRDDLGWAAGDQWQEALWLLGESAASHKEQLDRRERPPLGLRSRAFTCAGIYTMRADESYMLVDAGPVGQNGFGGHAHNDTLSYELFAFGQTLVTDSGTYAYTSSPEWRNRFRSTLAHNTATLDDLEIVPLCLGSDIWGYVGQASTGVERWHSTSDWDLLEVWHSGFLNQGVPVIHRRTFFFDKSLGAWLVEDHFEGEGAHEFRILLHFKPACRTRRLASRICAVTTTSRGCPSLAIVLLHRGNVVADIAQDWVSPSYGLKIEAPKLQYTGQVDLPCSVPIALLPSQAQTTDAAELLEKADQLEANLRKAQD